MRSTSYALVMLLGMATPSAAQFITGNDLQEGCTGADPKFPIAMVRGFVMGVFDQVKTSGFGKGYLCVPGGVTAAQAQDLVCLHLSKFPQDRHYPASVLAYQAMIGAWSCPKQ